MRRDVGLVSVSSSLPYFSRYLHTISTYPSNALERSPPILFLILGLLYISCRRTVFQLLPLSSVLSLASILSRLSCLYSLSLLGSLTRLLSSIQLLFFPAQITGEEDRVRLDAQRVLTFRAPSLTSSTSPQPTTGPSCSSVSEWGPLHRHFRHQRPSRLPRSLPLIFALSGIIDCQTRSDWDQSSSSVS